MSGGRITQSLEIFELAQAEVKLEEMFTLDSGLQKQNLKNGYKTYTLLAIDVSGPVLSKNKKLEDVPFLGTISGICNFI